MIDPILEPVKNLIYAFVYRFAYIFLDFKKKIFSYMYSIKT